MKNSAKRMALRAIWIALCVALLAWVLWSNQALVRTDYTIASQRVPESFDGFRIAQVSDLHNAQIGKDNEKLLAMLREAEPDMIAITGDLVDSRKTNVEIALRFAEQAAQIAPCYYVSGNHEARIAEYDALKAGLIALGVVVLEGERMELEKNRETMILLGVDDPSFQTDYLFGDAESVMNKKLQPLMSEDDAYAMLLSHRPELFDAYAKSGVDLVLSGHAHGGQFRLPFIGGLVAPNQGFFPKYDAGLYTYNGTNMIVSRGIGNSIIPVRFNNRPEVVLIELVHM